MEQEASGHDRALCLPHSMAQGQACEIARGLVGATAPEGHSEQASGDQTLSSEQKGSDTLAWGRGSGGPCSLAEEMRAVQAGEFWL